MNGGTNDMSSLQILCKSSHWYKTKTEIEDGSNVKIPSTESSYDKKLEKLWHLK